MNEILQKRIEEASIDYTMRTKPMCIAGDAFADIARELNKNPTFIAGATFALQNQWISVEEALPEENELVFGCVNDESTPQAIGMAYYDEYGGWHYSDEEEISLITHWMPIPSLKGGEE